MSYLHLFPITPLDFYSLLCSSFTLEFFLFLCVSTLPFSFVAFPMCFSFLFSLFDSLSFSFHPLLPFVMRTVTSQTLETYRSLYLVFYFHSPLSHQHLLPLGQTGHHHQNRAQLLLLKFSRVLPEFYHHSAIGSLSSSFQSDHHTKRILKSAADLHPLFLFLADRTSSFSSLDIDIIFLYFFCKLNLSFCDH